MIQTTLNGRDVAIEPKYAGETLIEYLRGRGQLTGTKAVCGAGACGACTVLVDGRPMTSCLLPLEHIAGREVQTVEYHGPDNLHPVQRAFMANDALQCGFCTPGFINSSIAFYETWREHQGNARPERAQIAAALAGNLCRCGAYPAIYEALAQACAGEFDGDEAIEPPRYEALDKVTGRAKYTADQWSDDQLEGVMLRSQHPHAKVVAIDPSEALAQEGVFAFVEILENDRIARYAGQPIGALAATDRRTAAMALKRVKVTYEVYPASVGPERAVEPDAPECFGGFGLFRSPPSTAEGFVLPGRWQGNVRKNVIAMSDKASGRARRQIKRAREQNDPGLIELTMANAVQVHTALEPHVCVAHWIGRDRLNVHLSTQGVHYSAHTIAERFDLNDEQVHLTAEHIGGGFGGKQSVTEEVTAAVTLARQAGRPVRVAYGRLEEMSYAALRPGSEAQVAVLTGEDGAIEALSVNSFGDAGIAAGTALGRLFGLACPDVPRETVDCDVINHAPPGKPFRGPDGPQTMWALERMADEVAAARGLDPITLRRRWYADDPVRLKLLDWAEALPVWAGRPEMAGNGRYRRGVGLGLGVWLFLYNGDSQVVVGAAPGGFVVRVGTQDIGTGTRSVLAAAVAGVFGVRPSQVKVEMGHSTLPLGPTSGGSQVTNSVYGPAVTAAEKLRDQLLAIAGSQLGWSDAVAQAGGVQHGDGFTPWFDVLDQVAQLDVAEARGSEPALSRLFELMGDKYSPNLGRGQSKAITVTEVEVDMRLGKVRPLGVWMALAAGKIFAPVLARSQVYGGIVQGLSYALYERRQLDVNSGFMVNANLEDYHLPGIGDTPPMEVHFIEEGFETIRSQGIGIGELATVGVAASVGNAVRQATGWRPLKTPILPADILQGVGR